MKFKTKKYNQFKQIFGNKKIIKEEVDRALANMSDLKPFYCKKCGILYQPVEGQWIFYNLCEQCFAKFDKQKMIGRLAYAKEGRAVKHFEDVDEWIKHGDPN